MIFSVSRLGHKYCASVAFLCCKRVPYFCQNHVDGRSKTNIFASKYLNVRPNLSVLMKNMQILGKTQILDFSAPYCRESKIQHPTDCTANLQFITAKSLHLPRLTNNTVGVHNGLQNVSTRSQDNKSKSSINQ